MAEYQGKAGEYELRGAGAPTLQQALRWIGSRVDDLYGSPVGRLDDVLADPTSGEPTWLLVRTGASAERRAMVPASQATQGAGHVWVPYEREQIRTAPGCVIGAPISHELDSLGRSHYSLSARPAPAPRRRAPERRPRTTRTAGLERTPTPPRPAERPSSRWLRPPEEPARERAAS